MYLVTDTSCAAAKPPPDKDATCDDLYRRPGLLLSRSSAPLEGPFLSLEMLTSRLTNERPWLLRAATALFVSLQRLAIA